MFYFACGYKFYKTDLAIKPRIFLEEEFIIGSYTNGPDVELHQGSILIGPFLSSQKTIIYVSLFVRLFIIGFVYFLFPSASPA
jgi:hypothetical protein